MVVPPASGGSAFATVNRAATASATPRDATPNGTPDAKAKAHTKSSAPMPASLPLSARRAEALDLSTVERRGLPTQARPPLKRTRLHDIPDAPVYRPTEEEFRDPMAYMHKIAPEGRQYGIVKIIPPDTWNPPFAIDTTRFHFRVRRQELNSVEGGTRANLNYLDALAKFHRQHGVTLMKFPSVDKRPLDLYKLKKAVEARGGFENVCKLKKWAEIGRDLGYSGKIMSSLSTSLKNSYQKWLHPYEEWLRVAKPGVQQQLEMENGGPFTPSPGPSPVRKVPSQQQTPNENHPALQASALLNATINGSPRTKEANATNGEKERSQPPPGATTNSGFTAVNRGGFTAVNHSSSGFTAVNGGGGGFRSYSAAEQSATNGHTAAAHSPAPPVKSEGLAADDASSSPHPHLATGLKRQLDNNEPAQNGDTDGRRSKRLKQDDPPMVVGSNMNPTRHAIARYPHARDRTQDKPGEICEACEAGPKSDLLQCESCDFAYHMGCLDPPLSSKPGHEWNCPRCLVGTGEFGFEEGEVYSLKQFQDRAKRFKDIHFADKQRFDSTTNKPRPIGEEDVEREFWRLVENITETVEVEYGADIHSTTHGSGFPTIEKQPRDQYSTDPWNLNVLPLYGESLFRHIKSDISGMTVPWLYVGMVFSTFCWHNEDHYAYSANYQHFGDTKTWYGIPAEDADKFEQAMRDAVPELFETQPDLLFQLVTLLPPDKLRKAGVRVYAIDQRAGELVITFPQAYHAGFNHGFNFNEAVNFAPIDWEPFGDAGVERLRTYRRQPCFSHDELLLTAALRDTTIKTAKWLGPALERILAREELARETFLSPPASNGDVTADVDQYRGPRYERKPVIDMADLEEDDVICSFCKCFSFMSRYKCETSGKVLCLLHAGGYECCEAKESDRYSAAGNDHTLYYRMTDAALHDLVSKVSEKANMPQIWNDKVEALLADEPRPQLKLLRTLVNEGERIPFELPRLAELRKFVERCNEWVEEATNYITRKQTRRKSDKPGRKSFARQAEIEDQAKEFRKLDNIRKLLIEAEEISFTCPEIDTLQERAENIEAFQRNAREALLEPRRRSLQEYEELCEVGKAFSMDMPEISQLEVLIDRMRWRQDAHNFRSKSISKQQITSLLERAEKLSLREGDPDILHYKDLQSQVDIWETRARDLLKVENASTNQLEGLANHGAGLPVDPEVLEQLREVVKRQREVHEKILTLCQRSQDSDFRKRPLYKDAKELMESLADVTNKPGGTAELEKQMRAHEDWMRKGKKLFGKTNAPLHILLQHMEIVRARNEACFDLEDKPRMPVEPSSRAASPVPGSTMPGDRPTGDVFCLCRKPEAGMMIECEICHEWYHGRCLKLARGKVKEDDKYKCPVCDWKGKIPRDAARPKLEELLNWQEDLEGLPFQPDEEDCLQELIDNAQSFRDYIQPIVNPMTVSPEEVSTMRFYLRKIEGADIHLAYESNFLRQELHKLAPVNSEAPPVIEQSGSTRKARPTKLQKLMAQYKVTDPDDLPDEFKQKPAMRRKIQESKEKLNSRHSMSSIKPASETPADIPGGPIYGSTPRFSNAGIGGISSPDDMPGLTYTNDVGTSLDPGYDDAPMFSHSSGFAATGTTDSHRPITPTGGGSSNLDPALFGPGPPAFTSPNTKELDDRVFADMVQQDDDEPVQQRADQAMMLAQQVLEMDDDGAQAGP